LLLLRLLLLHLLHLLLVLLLLLQPPAVQTECHAWHACVSRHNTPLPTRTHAPNCARQRPAQALP
jgi:hypothetical protein